MILKAREVLESDDYLSLPDRFDINEYGIMEDFCSSIKDNEISADFLYRIRGRGAFRRFKDALQEYGLTEKWCSFRQNELERIAIDWLEMHQLAYTKDDGQSTRAKNQELP